MDHVYKFVSWDIPPLEELKNVRAYKIKEKLNKKEKLSREEKDGLARLFNYKHSVPVMGWMFDFSDVCKPYVVKQYGHWYEYWAYDKTALRKALHGRIDKIVEV